MQNVIKKRENGTTNQSKPARRNLHRKCFVHPRYSTRGWYDCWIRQGQLYTPRRVAVGGNRMKGIPTPLCQIAFPSALSNARVWVKGQLRWRPSPGWTPASAQIRNDSGLGHNGIPCFLSGNKIRRNKRGGDVDSFSILTRCLPRPSTSLVKMNERTNEREEVNFESLEIVDVFSNTCVSIVYFN